MKKYIVLIAVILFGFLCGGCNLKHKPELNDLEQILKRGYIIVGVKEDSPPFGYYKDGSLQGIDIDIAKKIAEKIFNSPSDGYIHFVKVNTQNRISKLNSKEVDILVATMSINEKRKLVINYSKPYFVANQKLVVRKNSKIAQIQYFNTSGKLGVVLGTTGEKIIHLAAPTARITGARTYKEAFDLLHSGQIDGIIGDDCILQSYLTENLRMINKIYSREYYGVAVRKSEKSKELLNEVNGSISQILDDKKIGKLKL